jgi:hypothetical protein
MEKGWRTNEVFRAKRRWKSWQSEQRKKQDQVIGAPELTGQTAR